MIDRLRANINKYLNPKGIKLYGVLLEFCLSLQKHFAGPCMLELQCEFLARISGMLQYYGNVNSIKFVSNNYKIFVYIAFHFII